MAGWVGERVGLVGRQAMSEEITIYTVMSGEPV